MALVSVEAVSKFFPTRTNMWSRDRFFAVDNVSLEVEPGQTLGIVGESGSGKSTLLRIMLRLVRPSAGRVLFKDNNIWSLSGGGLRQLRRQVQAVFQDPYSSFNPRQTIAAILSTPLEVHGIGTRASRFKMIAEALERVGLQSSFTDHYPHQLSGGQRQRVAIARAIILRPSLVLADEPTSALDVSVQAQILNLLKAMKKEFGLTYVFVSHNLGVIRYISDSVVVMHRGTIVEAGASDRLFSNPQHEYTQALLNAVPDISHLQTRADEVPVS
jgi:ABC-type oligopeptide transport system ATPase subunit